MTLHTLCLGELATNCYVLWDDHRTGVVIDPADEATEILSLIKAEKLNIVAVVLTHAHFDHMSAAEAVCGAVGAPLYVGRYDEAALADPHRNLSGVFQMGPIMRLSADITLCEGDVLTVGELSFTVLETPGHTPGSVCLLGDGLLISGDTLFRDSIGRVDFPGGDASAMMASLHRLSALPEDTAVYAGHGQPTTIGRERQYNPYIR